MRFLLLGISRPYFRRHWVITALTASGVALGVGVFIAIQLSASSLKVSMRQTVDLIAGKTQIEVSAGEAGFPEEIVERVRAVPGVQAAQPIVEAVVRSEGADESSILVLGIDFLGDRQLRDFDFDEEEVLDDPLVFLAQPDSICLTREFAARHGLEYEDSVGLETGRGFRKFTVRGLMRPEGAATAFGGNIALMDLYAAQYAFARGRSLDRVDVLLAPGLPVDEGRRRIAAALGPGYEVEPPARRGAQMEVLIENFGALMTLSSWQALFIAVFLIFNVFAVAATRRRREIGILRSLGVTRGQIMRLFLVEGAIIGAAGSAVGVAAGLLLAGITTRFIIRLTEMAYGITHSAPVLVIDPRVLAVGTLMGVASAVAAAFFPARGAALLQPVDALAKGRFQRAGERQNRLRLAVGALSGLAAAGTVLTFARSSLAGAIVGLLMINMAAVLLAPSLVALLVRSERPILQRLVGVEGRLAADSLAQAPRRTSATVLALMISVAFVISLAGMSHSLRKTYTVWLEGVINADFYIKASERFFSTAYRLPPESEPIVAAIPGVRWVEPFRGVHIDFRGRRPLLETLPLAKTYQRLDPFLLEGSRRDLVEGVARGKGFAISMNLARLFEVRLGDPLRLDTPTGPLTLPVLAIVNDYSSDQGVIWLDRSVYVERWKDTGFDTLDVILEKSADKTAVAAEIRKRLAGSTNRLFVMSSTEYKQTISRILDQFFGLSWIQLAIALLVAVMGIANTLVISVHERRRELGILKSLGAVRRQVIALVLLEALAIVSCGGLLGYALGSYLIEYSVDTLTARNTGWLIPYAFPWAIAAGLAPLLVAVTLFAALYPARLALGVSPAEALEFE